MFPKVEFVFSIEKDYSYVVEVKIKAYSLSDAIIELKNMGIDESQIKN